MTAFNLAAQPVPALDLSEEMFDTIFRDLFPQENANPTLGQLMARSVRHGVHVIGMVGSFNTSSKVVLPCLFQALVQMAERTPSLQKLLHDAGLNAMLYDAASGNFAAYADELLQRRNMLRAQRNGLQDMAEPTPFDRQQLEQTQRVLTLTCALEDLYRMAACVHGDNLRNAHQYLARVFAAAEGHYVTRGSKPLQLTHAQEEALFTTFAEVFLATYASIPSTVH